MIMIGPDWDYTTITAKLVDRESTVNKYVNDGWELIWHSNQGDGTIHMTFSRQANKDQIVKELTEIVADILHSNIFGVREMAHDYHGLIAALVNEILLAYNEGRSDVCEEMRSEFNNKGSVEE